MLWMEKRERYGNTHYIMKALLFGKLMPHAWYDLTETDDAKRVVNMSNITSPEIDFLNYKNENLKTYELKYFFSI